MTAIELSGAGEAAAAASFVAYLVVVAVIGVAAARFSSAGLANYFVAGRRMPRWIVALSAVVSGRSSWLMIGLTGLAYVRGASAVWAVVGYVVAELFMFLLLAPRLRRYAEARDCVTVPDVLAGRVEDRGAIRIVLAAIMAVFLTGYVAAQLVAGGKALSASFEMSAGTGVVLTAAVVLFYTVVGGFLAVSLTDALQAVVMLVALVVLPAVALSSLGGVGALAESLRVLDPALLDPSSLGFGAFVGFVAIGLGSPGSPHVLVRYLSIRDARDLPFAALVATTWNVVLAWGAIFVGLVGRALHADPALLPGADPESIYPVLALEQLPPWLFGVILAALFAAIMSTADSQLLVAASGLVNDAWVKVLRRGRPLDERRIVVISRVVVAGLVVVAVALAFAAEHVEALSDLVFWLVLLAWAGLGSSIGPTILLAAFWKRTTRQGVLAGLVGGSLVTLVWAATPALDSLVYELVPGFAAGLLATIAVSLATRPPEAAEAHLALMRGERPLPGGERASDDGGPERASDA